MSKETKTEDKTAESTPTKITDSIIGQCMISFDICPLKEPIKWNGETYDCMLREREGVVRDRVHAVRWSSDEFGEEYTDAIRAFFIAEICRFGKLELETQADESKGKDFIKVTQAELQDKKQLPVDCIIDALSMKDYASVSYMLGKL